ncbi:oligosaccharide flippase family protein [Shewanella woodyi]|uniref:oligosaccharide flippase family protein n=1 Tax=Shewanella woodyi TaxID=60961 RepID=UPI00374A8B59
MKKISGALLITLFQSAVSLVAQLSLARILSPDIFGQFATCSILVTILMALANLQCDKYIISGKGQTLQERFKASAYIEFLVAIVFFGLAVFVFPLILKLMNKQELIYYSLILACSVVYTPLTRNKAVLDSQFKFFKARLPQFIAQIIAAIVAIFLALNNYGLSALIAWRLCAYLLEVVILAIVYGPPRFQVVERESSKEILHFIKPLYWSAVIFVLYTSFDYYILAALISNRELGLYWLSFQLTNYLLILKTTLNNILLPYYSRVEDNGIKTALLNSHTKLLTLFYLAVSIVCMMLSGTAIDIVLGEEWVDMTVIFNLFTIVVMFKAFTSSFLPYLITVDKRKAELQSTVFALIVLVILLPILSIKMGIVGALMAVIISTLLSFTYLYFKYIYRNIEGNYFKTFVGMLLVSSLIFGCSLLSTTPRVAILTSILAIVFIMLIKYLNRIKLTLNEISGSYQ